MMDLAKLSKNKISIDTQRKTLKINTLSVNAAFKYLTPLISQQQSAV